MGLTQFKHHISKVICPNMLSKKGATMVKPKSKSEVNFYIDHFHLSPFPPIKDVAMLCHMSKDATLLLDCSEI